MTRGPAAAIRAVVRLAVDEEVTFLAAAIAYYAFVSVLPALLLALVVASTVWSRDVADTLLSGISEYLTPAGEHLLVDALASARGTAGATVVGVLVLAWTTLRVFRGLEIAFARVYGTDGETSFVEGIRKAALVALSIGVGIASMVAVGTALVTTDPSFGGGVAGLLLLSVGLAMVFLPLYYVFPGRPVSLRDVVPGTVVAAIGWVLLQALFQAYAAAAPRYELYGVIGGALLLVTWFYLASILVLLGAVVNVVLAEDRQVQHASPRDPR